MTYMIKAYRTAHGRVIFADNTDLHRALNVAERHGWDVNSDPEDRTIVHFSKTTGYNVQLKNVLYITATFGALSDWEMREAIVWRDADKFGGGQIWIPTPLFTTKNVSELTDVLSGEIDVLPGDIDSDAKIEIE